MTMRQRACERYDYKKVDSIQYVPSIEFITSDGLIRIASIDRSRNPDYPLHKVMLVFSIDEALDVAAMINRECVKAAEQ